jgi:ubiquinone/menaquinone biosynthesis C-methylase UbiE
MKDPYYEEWDEAYRHSLTELPWELGRPRPQLVELIESGTIKPCKALDICCGAGTNTIYLASRGFAVTGIDISPKAIEIAKETAKAAGVTVRFQVGNVVRLPYENEEFGFVFDMGCFHHIRPDDRDAYIKGVHRVLKDRGRYQLTCFSSKNGSAWNHFTEKEIVSYFSPYFEVEDVKHAGSVEGDGVTRYFYTVLMRTTATGDHKF